MPTTQDQRYLDLITRKIAVCREYQPKLGQGRAVSLPEFKTLYGADLLYSWFGLDDPLMYATHRAAGGMTSLYRQIGNGLELVFRQVLRDQLGLSDAQAKWSYSERVPGRATMKKLSLDGRIEFADVANEAARTRVRTWALEAATELAVAPPARDGLAGAVFEVRQGYKSKDSKRQNADIANARVAYKRAYLPVVVLMSAQIDREVADRYRDHDWLVLRGTLSPDPLASTFAFTRDVLGYDLGGLLQRNAPTLRALVRGVLDALLSPAAAAEPASPAALRELASVDETNCIGAEDPPQGPRARSKRGTR